MSAFVSCHQNKPFLLHKNRAILNEYLLKVILAYQITNSCVVMNLQILNIWGNIYLVK